MKKTKSILIYLLLAIGALIMVFPFIWMILSSLKTAAEVNSIPPTFFPANATFENYTYALEKAPFLIYFRNSVIVTIACVICTQFTTNTNPSAMLVASFYSHLYHTKYCWVVCFVE